MSTLKTRTSLISWKENSGRIFINCTTGPASSSFGSPLTTHNVSDYFCDSLFQQWGRTVRLPTSALCDKPKTFIAFFFNPLSQFPSGMKWGHVIYNLDEDSSAHMQRFTVCMCVHARGRAYNIYIHRTDRGNPAQCSGHQKDGETWQSTVSTYGQVSFVSLASLTALISKNYYQALHLWPPFQTCRFIANCKCTTWPTSLSIYGFY